MDIDDKVKVKIENDWVGVVTWIAEHPADKYGRVVHMETDGTTYRFSENMLEVIP